MGRTKWHAAAEDDFHLGKNSSQRRRPQPKVQMPGKMHAPKADERTAQDLARLLNVRVRRLLTALKFRWYYAKRALLGSGSLVIKLSITGLLGYLLLYYDRSPQVVGTIEQEAPESSQPIALQTEASEPIRPDKPGGRELLLPKNETPVAPPAPTATERPQMAVDPSPAWLRESDEEQVKRYVERFSTVAVQEMRKYGVPASIALAQGLIESRFGTSTLAVKNNNHFGIKCFSRKCRPGHCTNLEDDHHKDFFRKYKTAWESWRAHSILISTGRYARLKKHGRDYRAWARGLEELGYATDRNYSAKLIGVIERYNLQRFDSL